MGKLSENSSPACINTTGTDRFLLKNMDPEKTGVQWFRYMVFGTS